MVLWRRVFQVELVQPIAPRSTKKTGRLATTPKTGRLSTTSRFSPSLARNHQPLPNPAFTHATTRDLLRPPCPRTGIPNCDRVEKSQAALSVEAARSREYGLLH